ncbi:MULTISPECIES: sugar nucleotidyltransferase [Aeromonas]|uniref:sugar nucleotidyltransferase n=1 Tax=Aeromonas TaxID=642 RepID=UPI0009F580C7|nr:MULTISPECIES: sugar phosphate nucleotidyltransferase [Aeromonas]
MMPFLYNKVSRKGVILVGGTATRLYPTTLAVSKKLFPVYDKPMIYYSLSVLILARIREVLVICTPADLHRFRQLFGDVSQWWLMFSYAEPFLAEEPVCLILSDNLLYGAVLPMQLRQAMTDEQSKALAIIETPAQPASHYAVTDLYFFDANVVEFAKQLTPSARSELEITDINHCYCAQGQLQVAFLGQDCVWLDTGTPGSLQEAGQFIQTLEKWQGLKLAITWRQVWLHDEQLYGLAQMLAKSDYGQYFLRLRIPRVAITNVNQSSLGEL